MRSHFGAAGHNRVPLIVYPSPDGGKAMATKTSSKPTNAAKKAGAKQGAAKKVAAKAAKPRKAAANKTSGSAPKPKLLSGGNPQIAKAYGDALITRAVPGVRKAVKWNSPFYGVEDQIWFLSFHCFTKYIKVAFFRGTSLHPVPPGTSKQKHVRYLDIHEDDALDEAQFTAWVKQAIALPGEKM